MSKLDRLLDTIEKLPPSQREMAWELAVGAKSYARRQLNAAHRKRARVWEEAEEEARIRLERAGDEFSEDDVDNLATEILYGGPEEEFTDSFDEYDEGAIP